MHQNLLVALPMALLAGFRVVTAPKAIFQLAIVKMPTKTALACRDNSGWPSSSIQFRFGLSLD